jgi:hypothetical protein
MPMAGSHPAGIDVSNFRVSVAAPAVTIAGPREGRRCEGERRRSGGEDAFLHVLTFLGTLKGEVEDRIKSPNFGRMLF